MKVVEKTASDQGLI